MTETLQEIGTLQFLSTKISKKVKKKYKLIGTFESKSIRKKKQLISAGCNNNAKSPCSTKFA
jgi:hypothetical protein